MIGKGKSRKAVSPVIAALLLIAISVAASVITYSWVTSMIKNQANQAQTSVRVEDVSFYRSGSGPYQYGLGLNIRNTGAVPVTIATIYMYEADTRLLKADGIDYSLGSGLLKAIGLTNSTSWSSSWDTVNKEITDTNDFEMEVASAYYIKIVTDNGFSIEGTFYSPSAW